MNWIRFSLLLLATGVIASAFGAHLLKEKLSIKAFEIYETATFYHLLIGVILLILSYSNTRKSWSMYALSIGLFIFCSSLYFMAIFEMTFLGVITPIGGMLIILGLLGQAFMPLNHQH